MKKVLCGLAVLAMANVAFASPVAFSINGGTTIEFEPGQTISIPVIVDGATGISGSAINLEVTGNFEIVSLTCVTGTVFESNFTEDGSYYQGHPFPDGTEVPANLAIGGTTTAAGTVNANPGVVAVVTVKAIGVIGDAGDILTDGPFGLGASDVILPSGAGLGAAQASTGLLIVPEPVSALLLLAGLPLVWRRRG